MRVNGCSLFLLALLAAVHADGEVRLLSGDANNHLHEHDGYLLDLSADGNLVLFNSGPPITGSTPGITQDGLYIRNLAANTLTFTSATNIGGDGSLSDNGRYVAWRSPANLIFWRDCQAGETRSITPTANGTCARPILSADGRFVAYVSLARNLVANTNLLPANGRAAVYLYDSQSRTTTVASLTYDGKGLSTGVGSSVPAIEFDFSANGRYVFFGTDSTNVSPERLALAPGYQVFTWLYRRNLTNGVVDVVGKNATNGIPLGNFSSPATDATGNRVAFLASVIGVFGGPLMISNYVANINADVYLKDLTSREVWWISKTTNGTTPDASFSQGGVAISGDGQVVAFGSTGTKFVSEDTDPFDNSDPWDVFRVDVGPGGTATNTLITKPVFGITNVSVFSGPCLSSNGNYVAFTSRYHYGLIGSTTRQPFFYHSYGVGTMPGGVVIRPPALKFTGTPGQLTLAWPNTAGVNLYFKTNITDAVWTLAPNVPVPANDTNTVTLASTGPTRFFVLRSP
jgi:hypothetical protein